MRLETVQFLFMNMGYTLSSGILCSHLFLWIDGKSEPERAKGEERGRLFSV